MRHAIVSRRHGAMSGRFRSIPGVSVTTATSDRRCAWICDRSDTECYGTVIVLVAPSTRTSPTVLPRRTEVMRLVETVKRNGKHQPAAPHHESLGRRTDFTVYPVPHCRGCSLIRIRGSGRCGTARRNVGVVMRRSIRSFPWRVPARTVAVASWTLSRMRPVWIEWRRRM